MIEEVDVLGVGIYRGRGSTKKTCGIGTPRVDKRIELIVLLEVGSIFRVNRNPRGKRRLGLCFSAYGNSKIIKNLDPHILESIETTIKSKWSGEDEFSKDVQTK